ncbi:MAG: hypothetical protein IJM50_04955 [Lachnospiraceae bacterium]|nr:hypothetical protein [Lachnospiraceae bacterium]
MALGIVPLPKRIEVDTGVIEKDVIERRVDERFPEEGYLLKGTKDGVLLVASNEAGFNRGEATYSQIRMQQYIRGIKVIPCFTCFDFPNSPDRAFRIDCEGHVLSAEDIQQIITPAAFFKMNHCYWYFAEGAYSDEEILKVRAHAAGFSVKVSVNEEVDSTEAPVPTVNWEQLIRRSEKLWSGEKGTSEEDFLKRLRAVSLAFNIFDIEV